VKIAVNTRLLLPHKLEGIGWFTYEVFKRLTRQHPEIEWHFLFDRPYDQQFIFTDEINARVVWPPSRHPLLWYLWFEWSIPSVLSSIKPDLFVSPDGYMSLRSKTPGLAVIHDINFEHHRDHVPRVAGWYYRHFFPRYARHATRIATVSEYSRQDIAKTYGVDPDKIDLVYNGCGDFFTPIQQEEKFKVRQEVSHGKPYFIFIGALNPRKNITGMLAAFNEYCNSGGQASFVIVGEKMFWNEEIEKSWEQHAYRDRIIFTGRLEGEALNRVLAAGEALLFVSHFEGFGIPIVEAFQAGVPVITSTTTSMPEVAGDAALLCDPDKHSQIAGAMRQVEEPLIRNKLIEKGTERARLFSWDRSAEMMWESIEKSLGR
jgi:glycosyltransferase involved in cell wall biosynthesis